MSRLLGPVLLGLLACGCGATPPPQHTAPPPTTEVKTAPDGTETTTSSIPDK